jgi:hypothetical protein
VKSINCERGKIVSYITPLFRVFENSDEENIGSKREEVVGVWRRLCNLVKVKGKLVPVIN